MTRLTSLLPGRSVSATSSTCSSCRSSSRYTGLRTDIGSLNDGNAWLWCVLLIAVATLGKFGGCYVAARVAGLNRSESKIIGVMMNTRGLMELVVVNVGFDLGVIGKEMFTMLVLMAIFSTVITSPALRRWLPAFVMRRVWGVRSPLARGDLPAAAFACTFACIERPRRESAPAGG